MMDAGSRKLHPTAKFASSPTEKYAAKRAKTTERILSTRKIAMIGMFSAIAAVLMLFEIPMPFAPGFYKLDFNMGLRRSLCQNRTQLFINEQRNDRYAGAFDEVERRYRKTYEAGNTGNRSVNR